MMEGIIQGVGGFVGGVQVQDDQFESGMQRITHILGWWGQLIIINPLYVWLVSPITAFNGLSQTST